MSKVMVPVEQMHEQLRAYNAEPLREYSNTKRHVYYLSHSNQYLTVRRKGSNLEFEFTAECPCGTDD